MTRRELSEQEREDFVRLMRLGESHVDWEQEAAGFEARKALADEMNATGVDPYWRRLKEKAVEGTGGESSDLDRDREFSEEA